MNGRTVTSPTAGPAQAAGRAAVPARIGMFAAFGLLERQLADISQIAPGG